VTDTLSIALAQLNPTVGDIAGNIAKLRAARAEAAKQGADILIGSELGVAGYPPEDLVLKPAFQDAVEAAVKAFAAETGDGGPAVILGAPWRGHGKLFNAALLLEGGEISYIRFKHELPNYGVFDEKRVFAAGPAPGPVVFKGVRLGLQICEDMWFPDVSETLGESGAEILIVINGSPFESDKADERLNLAVARITETGLPLLYVNQVGGQDELVFDGASFVLNADHSLAAQAAAWREQVFTTRWRREGERWRCIEGPIEPVRNGLDALYQAMMLGVRDYVNKNGFPGVLVGLSGGIDSALTAVVAADALGPARLHCVRLPSRYTSDDSMVDAEELAKLLDCKLDTVTIAPAVEAFDVMLEPALGAKPTEVTAENIQPRARALVLMALSNATGAMLLTTGNKSEMSVGYATLYGDMCGGYNALKDVYKTTVYALSRWRNQVHPAGALGPAGRVIPERIITKAPTAELKPNQTDQDTLPPYETLDGILKCLVEDEMRPEEIAAKGFELPTVMRVWSMLDRAEYKRRQAAPGVKLTRRAFGRDRRYPITNRFKG
jgi:NAD+ synthase